MEAKTEEIYRLIFENTGEGILLYDLKGKILMANKRAAEIWGYELDEFIGYDAKKLVAPESKEKSKECSRKLFEERKPQRVELLELKKNGEMIWIEATRVLFEEDGKIVGILSIVRDITERKEREELLKAILENAPLAVIVWEWGDDGKTIYTYWNRKAKELFGWTDEEVINQPARKTVPPDLMEKEEEIRKVLKEKGVVQCYETERITKDGRRIPVELTRALIRREGKPDLIVSIIIDISERKKLEKEREEAHRRAMRAEKLALLGQIAGSIAHDLRQPLSVISNAVYYLKMKIKEEKLVKHLDIMEKEIYHAERIISNLLDHARLKKPELKEEDLGEILMESYARSKKPEGVKTFFELEKVPKVKVDREQIRRVFSNIIANAFEAMPKGGELFLNLRKEGDKVIVEIKDTGVGIPDDMKEKIFDPLFTTKRKGTGFGLSVSRSIMENHEGAIRVESEEGKGAKFILEFPIGGGRP